MVTASHCIQGKGEQEPKKASDVQFYIGKHNLISWNEEGYVQSGASKMLIHPDWDINSDSYDADIAIVVLIKTVQYTNYIKSICLLNRASANFNDGVVAGWGKSEANAVITSEPKVIRLPVVSESICLRSHPAMNTITSNRTFCVGKQDGSGPCNGN